MWELLLATNFGSPLQMVTKVGSQILATKFGFVPNCSVWAQWVNEWISDCILISLWDVVVLSACRCSNSTCSFSYYVGKTQRDRGMTMALLFAGMPLKCMTGLHMLLLLNTLRLRQNGRHFAVDIFKCIFFTEICFILIQISLKHVPMAPIHNNPAMTWCRRVGGGWVFINVVATFSHVGGSFNLFLATTGDVWIIFSNLGLCAACGARFMCHHELWPTSVSHPFSSLNISLGFAGGKHYQKITIAIFRLVLQNFAIPVCSRYILFYHYLFSLLSSGWFVIAVCGSISVREVVKH